MWGEPVTTARLTNVRAGEKYYDITDDRGWSFFCPKTGYCRDHAPEIGDRVTFFSNGLGTTIRGLKINEHTVFYRTPAQEAQRQQKKDVASIRRQKAEFRAARRALNFKYSILPEAFKERIDGFRKRNPDFRWKFEAYEMFCCLEAAELALTLGTAEAVMRFKGLEFAAQKALMPRLSEDHSGNTFYTTCLLAALFLKTPTLVPNAHGAMCGLVGCKEYGCWGVSTEAKSLFSKDAPREV